MKIFTLALILIPSAIFAQNMHEMKAGNYSIQLQNKTNEVIFETVKNINPNEMGASSFNNMAQYSFTSICMKNEDKVLKETGYYTQGVRGDFALTNGDAILKFSFKKVLDKKEISLGDCNIEELVVDEADFIVTFPILEYEQTIKTAQNQYKIIVKKVP